VGEIWGGAFWEMRKRLGKEVVAPILADAWRSSSSSTQAFLKGLLAVTRAQRSDEQVAIVREVLIRREFPLAES
jgi:hypothetical protein